MSQFQSLSAAQLRDPLVMLALQEAECQNAVMFQSSGFFLEILSVDGAPAIMLAHPGSPYGHLFELHSGACVAWISEDDPEIPDEALLAVTAVVAAFGLSMPALPTSGGLFAS